MAVQPSNSGQKVNVFIRVRPLIQREKDAEETVNWYTDDKLIQQYQPGTRKILATADPFAFDQIFSEAATTENVYETAVAPIVEKSLQGFNGTVLCYGQTSSGKTHTMYGSEDEPGIISLTAQDLFRRFSDESRTYIMKIGLVEVYNEKLTDLLDPQKKQIDIKEVNGEAVPKGLTEIDVYSPEDMLDAAQRVQKERKIGETRMNKESSRSHTILRIIVQSTPNDDSEDRQMTNALLNFVDLAGSEKADQSGAVGDRFREATYINKSLTTLSIVVNQLSGLPTPSYGKSSSTMATGHTNAKQSKEPFVSYRGSKLTRILKSSLSGNAYIALICNMTPASVEETHSTLRFASRAKCIKVDPTKNLGPLTALEYKSKIQDLEKQLNGKSAEADNLRKQLEAVTKFFRPTPDFFISPAQPTAQLHRRQTTCPSMFFAHRTGILTDDGPGDEFKAPKSPARRSLMPTPASQKLVAGNNPPQCSILDKSLDINGNNFVVDEPGPPLAKLAKVDAQTWTEFSPLTALQFPPPKSPAPQKQLDRSVHFDPSQLKTCENLQAELEELRSRSERPQELKEKNTNMIKKLALLSSEVDAAKTERDAAQANMAILESEKEELASGFESLTMKLLDLESDYEDSQGQLANSLQSNVELQSTIDSLQQKLDSASRDSTHHSEELAQQFATVSAELVSFRQEYESTTIQLQTCKEALARSEAANESVSEELKALRSKGSIESEKLEAENQELTQQLASVSAELVSIQQQYESTTIQLQACKEVLAHSEAAHESVSKELEALRSKSSTESEQLKTENKALLNQLEEASQKVVTMELELSATRKSRESLHSQLTTVQEELEAIRSAATGSTDHLSKQCEALQCENESLRAERRAHLLETERMELDHQQVTFKYTKSVDMLSQLEEELAGVKKAKDLLQAELDSAAQVAQALSELKKKCEHLETQIKKLEAEKKAHSAIIADLTREKETSGAQIQRLQLDVEDKKALKKELEETKNHVGQLEQLQPQIDELQRGIAMKTTDIEALKIKLRQSETSLEIMRTQLASESQSKVDELQLQIQTLQAQVYGEKSGSATLKKANQQLSERQKTLQSDLEELKTRYNSLQSTAESANQKRSTLEQTVATLEARLAQAQQDRPRVSKRSTATQVGDTEDIMKELKDYHIYAARCKYQYKEAVKQLTTLKRELEECNKKNTENEKHIADFTARVVADSELIDSLQEQIRQIPETRETEVQCDIAAEVFTKAKKYILFDIPEGWQDFGEIYRRLCHFKSEASALQVEKSKCKCNGKDDKTSTLGFPGSRFAQGSTRPWFQSRPSPTIAKPAASSVSQTLAAVGPAVGRPGVLGTPAAVLSAQVQSVAPYPSNTDTPTQMNSSGSTQVTSVPIQSSQQPVRPSTVPTIARRFEPTASAAAAAPSQATRPPTVPPGILSTRPLHSPDDAPVISNVSKSGEESTGKIKFSSNTQTTQPDVVAPVSKRENGENQPPPPPKTRRAPINWDEPTRSIEELQKEMPRKRDFWSAPTMAQSSTSSASQTQAAVGPAIGRPGVLETPAAVLPAQVNSIPPHPFNTDTPTRAPQRNRRRRINLDEPCRSIEELQKEMPRKRDF